MLLDKYYIDEKPLPADVKAVQRLIGARTEEERQATETILREYFELTDDGWRSSKCDEVISAAQARIENARTNGKRGGRPKSNPEETQQKPSGFSVGLQNETQTKAYQSPSTNHQIPEEAAAGPREADNRLTNLLLDAAGQAMDQSRYGFQDLSRPKAWLAAGCDLELDVLPAIRRVCRDKPPMSVKGWVYFDGAVMDAKATRTKPLPIGQPQSSAGRPVKQKIYGRSAIDGDDGGSSAEGNRADAAVLDGSEGRGRDELGISDTRIAGVVRAAVRR